MRDPFQPPAIAMMPATIIICTALHCADWPAGWLVVGVQKHTEK
jgi:hypothetical protein